MANINSAFDIFGDNSDLHFQDNIHGHAENKKGQDRMALPFSVLCGRFT
jgi:hypothetical protein